MVDQFAEIEVAVEIVAGERMKLFSLPTFFWSNLLPYYHEKSQLVVRLLGHSLRAWIQLRGRASRFGSSSGSVPRGRAPACFSAVGISFGKLVH
jgi:hypothetical protein